MGLKLIVLILKVLAIIALTVLAAVGYRYGGSSHGQRWMRQASVGVSITLALTVLFGFNWWTLLCFGLSWAESTYFKRKGTDAKWYNWLLVGLVFALVPLPFVIADGSCWLGFIIRSLLIIPTTVYIGTYVGDVDWSEGLRGGIQIISLLLLLVGV